MISIVKSVQYKYLHAFLFDVYTTGGQRIWLVYPVALVMDGGNLFRVWLFSTGTAVKKHPRKCNKYLVRTYIGKF